MTGQDFQDRLDAIVADLQTNGKGQTVQIMFRNASNVPTVFPLESNSTGVVDASKLSDIQTAIDDMKVAADAYELKRAPVAAAITAFKAAREVHSSLITAASNARQTLTTALEADGAYQAAQTALSLSKEDGAYIVAKDDYEGLNLSENFAELSQAKGSYVV